MRLRPGAPRPADVSPSAATTSSSASNSAAVTGSPRSSALLNTPMIGMLSVLMAATLAGNMRTTTKKAQWQKIIGPSTKYSRVAPAFKDISANPSGFSSSSAPAATGRPPSSICQPTMAAGGVCQRKNFTSTVPAAQQKAAPSMKATPAGAAPRRWRSGPSSTAIPAVPVASASRRSQPKRSPSSRRLSRTAQSGIV